MPNALSPYQIRAIKDGYRYECPCGELLNSISAAANCSKCWDYAPAMAGRFVVDIKTDEAVHGKVPTNEEHKLILEEHDRLTNCYHDAANWVSHSNQ